MDKSGARRFHTDPAAFVVTGNACPATSLGPGQTCSITVQFTPAAESAMTATLTAASTNPVATGLDDPGGVAVDSSHLYWADDNDGAISAANLDGSNRHIIVTGRDFPQMMAVTPAGP
jgi:hypothetical protein